MDLAAHLAEAPRTTEEEVVGALREEGQHQDQIGDSQVHDEHVCGGTESRESAEDLEDGGIASNSASSNHEVEESQKVVPIFINSIIIS